MCEKITLRKLFQGVKMLAAINIDNTDTLCSCDRKQKAVHYRSHVKCLLNRSVRSLSNAKNERSGESA